MILPDLPSDLQELYCRNCTSLTSLPELPSSLQELDCKGCKALRKGPERTMNQVGREIVEENMRRFKDCIYEFILCNEHMGKNLYFPQEIIEMIAAHV